MEHSSLWPEWIIQFAQQYTDVQGWMDEIESTLPETAVRVLRQKIEYETLKAEKTRSKKRPLSQGIPIMATLKCKNCGVFNEIDMDKNLPVQEVIMCPSCLGGETRSLSQEDWDSIWLQDPKR